MSMMDNIVNRLFGARIAEAVKQELKNAPRWMLEQADVMQYRMPDPFIFANQADMYRLSPNLGTALDILANDVATGKFNVKRMEGEEEIDIPNHPFERLMRNPNPLQSGMEFIRDTVTNYQLNGNSIWWLNRASWRDKPSEMWTIPFSLIQPIPDGRMYIKGYEFTPGDGRDPIFIPTWQVVHFKNYNPNNPFVGLSKLESLAVTLETDYGMRVTGKRTYVEYGGAPASILAFKDYVPNEAWNDIKKEKQQAAMRNEMMMLRGVGDGVSWMARAMSNKDMEFIAMLRQGMIDIFNRMCPGLLAMLDPSATEANALAARATYSEKTLWVMMETLAQKVTSDVLPAFGEELKGEYDDPRVVDRNLELAEQREFAAYHTIEEVRAEYYGDDPLGDERDKLLVAQINAQSGGIQEAPEPPSFGGGAPEENMGQDTGGDDNSAKAAIDALYKWRKQAADGRTEKALRFTNAAIPVRMERAIKAALPSMTKEQAVKLFDRHIESLKPKPRANVADILKGIEMGVKALELKG